MRNFIFPIAFAMTIILSAATTISMSPNWHLAKDYSVKFISDDPTGVFQKMEGDIIFDENDLEGSKFNMLVDVSSINTGNGSQNGHATSAGWFDAKKFPKIIFESTLITKTTAGFEVKGNLNIKGVVKEIVFPFTFIDDVFKGSFMINRLDYNLAPDNTSASKELKVEISVPVMK